MANGRITITNPHMIAAIDKVKDAYLDYRRMMDALIVVRNTNGTNSDYASVQATADATMPGQDAATTGQETYTSVDDAMAGMTSAYNALSRLDKNAL